MARYRLFEVGSNGKLHDTEKTIVLESLDQTHVVSAVFKVYEFGNYYLHSYTIDGHNPIMVRYNYHEGIKATWALQLE